MQSQATDTLELYPRPSTALRQFIVVSHIAAFGVCGYLIGRAPWAMGLLPLVLGSLVYCLRCQQAGNRRRVARLIWQPQSQWHWYTAEGLQAQGRHLASSVRLRWLVILYLRSEPKGRSACVVLPYDSLPAEQHRRLRLRLRVDSTG